MTTIEKITLTEEHLQNLKYHFQPSLTTKLDLINNDFDQEIINEIVLWKVNRYAELNNDTFLALNTIKREDEHIDLEITKNVLTHLLSTKGIQLAMASTILRFKNPKIYQIIDQRVFRFINGENLPHYFSSTDAQISLYLGYLEKLKIICLEKQIDFTLSDRIIYELDKEFNGNEKIKY